MDATLNIQTLLLLVALGLCVVNVLAVLSLRSLFDGFRKQLEDKRDRLDTIDRRVVVLEERVAGIGEIKARLANVSDGVAALNERSKSTLEMVHSIQEFLREQSNERS